MPEPVDVVFEEIEPPEGRSGPCYAFLEVEDQDGASIHAGDWVEREDGRQVLRIRPSLLPDEGDEEGSETPVKGGAPPESWLVITRLEGYKQSIAKALGEQLEGGLAINPGGHIVAKGERVLDGAGRKDLIQRLRDTADRLEQLDPEEIQHGDP